MPLRRERGIGAGRAFAGKRKEEIGGEEGRGGEVNFAKVFLSCHFQTVSFVREGEARPA